jgi:hypothetical protein
MRINLNIVMFNGLLLWLASAPSVQAVEPPVPFVVIPLRVHILSAPELPDVDCPLTDADIRRVVGKVNGIWRPARIHWELESIRHEPAAGKEAFRLAMEADELVDLDIYKRLAPVDSKAADGMNVYYIQRFSVNGVFLGQRTAFVQASARLRPVEGGIDEPLPRVTAHELGHALGLPHRQARTNLLASGTNGTSLNDAEIARARAHATSFPGASTVAGIREQAVAAETAGDRSRADAIRARLAALPSDVRDPPSLPEQPAAISVDP